MRWRSGGTAGPLDLDAGPGVIHLRGANGSGKTSLLRAITGGLPRSDGEVTLDGRDPERDPLARARIGWVPAQPSLPGFLTVDEAWRFMGALRRRPDWDGGPICDALDLPRGLRLDQASTGTRRKAELVAAMAGEPELLVFDETLAHLDDHARAVLIGWIDGWRSTRLVLLTHHGPLAVVCDAAVELARG